MQLMSTNKVHSQNLFVASVHTAELNPHTILRAKIFNVSDCSRLRLCGMLSDCVVRVEDGIDTRELLRLVKLRP
jgi:hypothetical protein